MPLVPKKFGFYAILTDPVVGYETCARIIVDEGVAFLQLRIKDLLPSAILPIALTLRKLTLGSDTRFIVNDYPEIARECGADGVHIGQSDTCYEKARNIVGPGSIIGISTHSLEQVKAACSLKPDYIGIGPVFSTPTKKIPDPVIGIEGMKTMLAASSVPAVSIGGIDLTNLRQVLEAGAENFCMVRQVTLSKEPSMVIKEIKRIYREYYSGVW